MALTRSITYLGQTWANTYIRIDRLVANQQGVSASVKIYPDQAARLSEDANPGVDTKLYDSVYWIKHNLLTLDEQNDIVQAVYNYLKTQPEFAGSTDV